MSYRSSIYKNPFEYVVKKDKFTYFFGNFFSLAIIYYIGLMIYSSNI